LTVLGGPAWREGVPRLDETLAGSPENSAQLRRSPRLLSGRGALVACAVLLAGATLSACGGAGNTSDQVPKSTPDIIPPTDTSAEKASAQTTSTATKATKSTSTSSEGSSSSGSTGEAEKRESGGESAGTGGSSGSSSAGSAGGTSAEKEKAASGEGGSKAGGEGSAGGAAAP
jgi:cytoskeletal protein RodZ